MNHVKLANKTGLLKGFFFSGCTDRADNPYGPWMDKHMPPKKIIESDYLDDDSLLGVHEISEIVQALDSSVYLGLKVHSLSESKNLTESVGLNIDTLKALFAAAKGIVC